MSFQHKPSNTSIETHRNNETGRSCGSCSMCCYLPSFELDEAVKPKNQWCRHCSGHSCNIYAERPAGDHWYPKKSKIIVTSSSVNGDSSLVLHVHDKYPLRWREEPYYSDIKSWATHGLQSDTWVTKVVVRDELWIILPDKDILITSKYFNIVAIGTNEWDVIQRDMDDNEWRKLRLAEFRKRIAEAEEVTAA